MRTTGWLIFVLFVLLAGVTFIPAPAATVEQARLYFDEDVIARGQHYSFERRLLSWAGTFLHLGLLLAVAGSWGRRVTDTCRRLARGWWLPTLLLIAAFYYLLSCFIHWPFDLARFILMRDWGLSQRPLAEWLAEYRLSLALSAAIEGGVLVLFYLLLRWLPRWWWLAASLGTVVLAIAFAYLWPIWGAPLFNTFTPIGDPKWAVWEKPLREVIRKADVPVQDILVMDASSQSSHSNAYFTGFGPTRRIVIFDNLLKKFNLPEVESVMAHEIGHWWHDHILQGIALGGVGMLVGMFLLKMLLTWGERHYGLTGPSDPAGLPLILLAGFVASWMVMPLETAVSRRFERQADMMALELARQPEAFIAAEKKLAIDNIGNVAPAPWSVWLFSTHPPAVERIQMAEAWKKTR